MDGNNPLVLVNIDLAELDHLALDTINHRVYFTEAKAGRVIENCFILRIKNFPFADNLGFI
jgi:hypothetical protein